MAVVETTDTGGNLTVSSSPTRGYYRKFRVRTRGSIGEVGYSGWTVSSGSIRRKRLPPTPTIAAPMNASSTYNVTLRVLITTGVEPDGQTQIAEVQTDNGEWLNSVDNAEFFSVGGALGDNSKTIYIGSALAYGSHTVTVRCYDGATETRGADAARSFTVLASPFEEITANETHVKAAHMLNLRASVNVVRGYYGLAAYIWDDDIIAGKTQVRDWLYHIAEIRTAVENVITLLNAFEPDVIPQFDWLSRGIGRPRADVMNQLINLILVL